MTTTKKRPRKPTLPPAGKKWHFGWYEIRKAVNTGITALGAQIAYAASSDNIQAVVDKPGVFMAGISTLLAIVRFINELRKDNTSHGAKAE